MTHPNKLRGNRFEYRICGTAKEFDLNAKRVVLSGAAPDHPGDVEIEGILYQCKKRKKLPKWLQTHEREAGVIIAQNYGEPQALIPLKDFFELLRIYKSHVYGIKSLDK